MSAIDLRRPALRFDRGKMIAGAINVGQKKSSELRIGSMFAALAILSSST
jgi:hypothetical protein